MIRKTFEAALVAISNYTLISASNPNPPLFWGTRTFSEQAAFEKEKRFYQQKEREYFERKEKFDEQAVNWLNEINEREDLIRQKEDEVAELRSLVEGGGGKAADLQLRINASELKWLNSQKIVQPQGDWGL